MYSSRVMEILWLHLNIWPVLLPLRISHHRLQFTQSVTWLAKNSVAKAFESVWELPCCHVYSLLLWTPAPAVSLLASTALKDSLPKSPCGCVRSQFDHFKDEGVVWQFSNICFISLLPHGLLFKARRMRLQRLYCNENRVRVIHSCWPRPSSKVTSPLTTTGNMRWLIGIWFSQLSDHFILRWYVRTF